MKRSVFVLAVLTVLLAGCSNGKAPSTDATESKTATDQSAAHRQTASVEQNLAKQLLNAQPGDVITIPAGHYHFKRGLALHTNGVTIRGAGMHKTVLSFKGMVSGPQGLLVNGSNFTIEDLSIVDTMGDALKIKQGDNIVIRRVLVSWTRGPSSKNGAYGLYPIRTKNLLIEDCVAKNASDSGIYVGQSKNAIVRNNTVSGNVAGIEIENTTNADVYGNTATGNAGGILVFNMPNLAMDGHTTRVFKNHVYKNNHANFGAKGTPVASVPAGSGIVVNSYDRVEIFDNTIADNKTANVIVSGYFSTNYYNKPGVNPDYNPYPKGIYIHDNHYEGGGTAPGLPAFLKIKNAMFGKDGHFPNVIWDGFFDPDNVGKNGLPPPADRICVPNPDVDVLNLDGPNKYQHPRVDSKRFRCTLKPLPAVKLTFDKAAGTHA
ncbi:MAG TPA: parallel beta-helix domain-containing protein [Oleiagrimonas sp.]|nr:parallel beta-helix domain-containing protein [Oleiagrimonas sp.]